MQQIKLAIQSAFGCMLI